MTDTIKIDVTRATGEPVDLRQNRNTFLRRADVEALIDAKTLACKEKIAAAVESLNTGIDKGDRFTPSQVEAVLADIGVNVRAVSAMNAVKMHLALCEEFTLTDKQGAAVLANRSGYAVSVA